MPGYCGRVVSMSTCQAGGLWFKSSILSLLKYACGESDQLLCWLYTLAEVLHQRWISGNVYPVHLRKVWIRQKPLFLWNPEETSPEVQTRGISGPKNGHVSNKNFIQKKSWKNTIVNPLKGMVPVTLHYLSSYQVTRSNFTQTKAKCCTKCLSQMSSQSLSEWKGKF